MFYLEELMRKYKSTKLEHTGYVEAYSEQFFHLKQYATKVLEIGIQGGGSLRVWADYFHNAKICGIDILKKCKHYETEKISHSRIIGWLGIYELCSG